MGTHQRLVLASQSPRRSELLINAGFEIAILPTQISEIPDERLNLPDQIRDLARQKADACVRSGNLSKGHGYLVLAADTVVVLDGQILGKPRNRKENEQYLRRLSGKTHSVITAIYLYDLDSERSAVEHEISSITFGSLSDQDVATYVASGDGLDKAGGYGIQNVLAGAFVSRLEGSYDNIVGLPISLVKKMLHENQWNPVSSSVAVAVAVADNLGVVMEKIANAAARAGRRADEIRLIAVSKSKPLALIEDAVAVGQRSFGENYVQEAVEKIAAFPTADWHFIGYLQSKKAKQVVGRFSLIHSVDRLKLAEEIAKASAAAGIVQDVLLQIHVGDEQTKHGVTIDEAPSLIETLLGLKSLRLRGLMSLPPLCDSEREARTYFAEIRSVFEKWKCGVCRQNLAFTELSLGTSSDYEWAILEGATMVRVGTAIFGERA
jgi:MAF protein